MTEVAIRVHELVRDFKRVRALDHVSLEVPPGIVFGFLGPNGAGKTTLIRILLGLARPTAGRVEVLGRDPSREGDAVRANAGALLEHSGLYERLTAQQNLAFFARACHVPRAVYEGRIRDLLSRFGLWDRRTEVVGTWSRGMKQKLAVARAVLHRPPLVFLDEPTAGLDPVASAMLREDLRRLASDEGVTVFLTTHNLTEAEHVCALVGVVRHGRLVALGSPASLRTRQGGSDIRVVAPTMSEALATALGSVAGVREVARADGEWLVRLERPSATPDVIRWLVANDVAIEEVRRERASFERAFLDLMEPDVPVAIQ